MIFLLSSTINSSPTGSFFNTVGQLISIVFILFFTIGLIYLFAYIAKRLKFGTSVINNKNINIIEYKNVGNNNSIVLTSVGKKYILLGVSKDKVNLLCELDQDDIQIEENIQVQNIDFAETFKKLLKKKGEENKYDNKDGGS